MNKNEHKQFIFKKNFYKYPNIMKITVILWMCFSLPGIAAGTDSKTAGASVHAGKEVSVNENLQQSGRRITGKIIDPSGEPVVSATVLEKGTTNGTLTDVDGHFTLTCRSKTLMLTGLDNIDSVNNRDIYGLIFCQTKENGRIGYVEAYVLLKEYRNTKIKDIKSWKEYISNIYLMKDSMDCFNLTDCFYMEKSIKELYKNNTFEDYLKIVTEKCMDGECIIRKEYAIEKNLYSTLYYLYQNRYYSYFNDLDGFWKCRKEDDFYDKLININPD